MGTGKNVTLELRKSAKMFGKMNKNLILTKNVPINLREFVKEYGLKMLIMTSHGKKIQQGVKLSASNNANKSQNIVQKRSKAKNAKTSHGKIVTMFPIDSVNG